MALIAGLTVAAAGCGQVSMLKARMALKDAHTAYQQQDYRGAIARYEEAIAADATQTEAYFYLGNSYDNLYRPTRRGEATNDALIDNAVANYKKAVELEQRPELKKLALQYLANAYGADKLNDPAESEPVVQQLIDMDPTDPLNYFALARIYEDSGDYERAEETLVKARDARPTEPSVYTTLAAFYNRQGNFEGAIEALQSRSEREPNNPEAFYTIATYYWEKAYRDFSLSDPEKVTPCGVRPDGDRQGHLAEQQLHGGAGVQESAPPRAGQPRTQSCAAAGAAPRGGTVEQPRRGNSQGERGRRRKASRWCCGRPHRRITPQFRLFLGFPGPPRWRPFSCTIPSTPEPFFMPGRMLAP